MQDQDTDNSVVIIQQKQHPWGMQAHMDVPTDEK